MRKLKCGFIHFVIFLRSLYDNKIAVIENGTFEGLAGLQTLWVNIHLKRIYFHFSKVLNVSKIMDEFCFLSFENSFIYNERLIILWINAVLLQNRSGKVVEWLIHLKFHFLRLPYCYLLFVHLKIFRLQQMQFWDLICKLEDIFLLLHVDT